MKKRLSKAQQKREDQACEAIVAGILRGWEEKEWKECFRRIDEKSKLKKIADSLDKEIDGAKIYDR